MKSSEQMQTDREKRAACDPIVPNLPAQPGIRAAMELSPELGRHLRGLADTLLVKPFPGSSLTRFEAELLATRVSSANGCFFCMDSHACHANAVAGLGAGKDDLTVIEDMKLGDDSRLDPRFQALVKVALNVQRMENDHAKTVHDVENALGEGASAGDIQHTVAIAAAFSMYNRFVEGLGSMTPASTEVYEPRARHIAEFGYDG